MDEIWKDVVGYEGLYEVSNLGRVKSLAKKTMRSDGRENIYHEKVLGGTVSDTNRMKVGLSKDGSVRFHEVQNLVLLAFVGPKSGPKVRCSWKDNNPLNNHLDNLFWERYEKRRPKYAFDCVRTNINETNNNQIAHTSIPDIYDKPGKSKEIKLSKEEQLKMDRREIAREVISELLKGFSNLYIKPLVADELDEIISRMEKLSHDMG